MFIHLDAAIYFMISVKKKKKTALVQIRRPFGEDRMLRGLSQRVGLGGRVATEQFYEEMAVKQMYIIYIYIHILYYIYILYYKYHIILYYIIFYIIYYIIYIYIYIIIYYGL